MPAIKVDDLSEALPSLLTTVPDVAPDQEKSKAVEECRQMLDNFRVPLCNNVVAIDMLNHLQLHHAVDAEKAKQIRRTGKGSNQETNQTILDELLTRGMREFEVYQKGLRAQNLSLLADLLEQRHFSKLMPILDPVAKKLGHHWKRIALELGMGGSIPRIESKYVRLREQALYSLLMWEDTSGVAATQKRLMDALDACGMKRALAYVKKLNGGGKKKRGGKKKKGSAKPGTGKKR